MCDFQLQALKQLLLETDKRENQGLPKVSMLPVAWPNCGAAHFALGELLAFGWTQHAPCVWRDAVFGADGTFTPPSLRPVPVKCETWPFTGSERRRCAAHLPSAVQPRRAPAPLDYTYQRRKHVRCRFQPCLFGVSFSRFLPPSAASCPVSRISLPSPCNGCCLSSPPPCPMLCSSLFILVDRYL